MPIMHCIMCMFMYMHTPEKSKAKKTEVCFYESHKDCSNYNTEYL